MSFGSDDGFDDGIPRDAFYDARQASLNVPLSYVCCWHGCCCCSPVPQLYTANTLTFRCRGRAWLWLWAHTTSRVTQLRQFFDSIFQIWFENARRRRKMQFAATLIQWAYRRHLRWVAALELDACARIETAFYKHLCTSWTTLVVATAVCGAHVECCSAMRMG